MAKKLLTLGCCILLCINLCGCIVLLAGAVGGAGTALWLSGKLSDEISAPYAKTIDATKKALTSLKMAIAKEIKTDDITQIKSNYTDGSEVWIDIRPLAANNSKIEIRVGVKGDKEASGKILEQIKRYI